MRSKKYRNFGKFINKQSVLLYSLLKCSVTDSDGDKHARSS